MPVANTKGNPPRIVIQYPEPTVDAGRYPAKRVVGDTVRVRADVFRDGHEILRAVVRYRGPGSRRWVESPMRPIDAHVNGVRWEGGFPVDTMGRWQWSIEAWSDVFATWRDELQRKIAAGQEDLAGELSEGVVLLEQAAGRAKGPDKKTIEAALAVLEDPASPTDSALAPDLFAAMERASERSGACQLDTPLVIEVDRVPAAFASWYELFPRSWGGLKEVEKQIPAIAELGFDVLYFPPIHPIGVQARKGRNNTLTAGPDDPGSPYAIGGKEGGHDAVHPELGTMDDVRALCATAREHGMDVALDLALNSSSSTRSGSSSAPTARSSTPRTRPSATRTSTTSTGTRRPGASCGRRGATSSCIGSRRGSSSSASTTRTRSRSRSGSG
jgi:starch synthase (maltosyl-transferring)